MQQEEEQLKSSPQIYQITSEECRLQEELKAIFKPFPWASKFVLDYTCYVHLIDDIIDEPKDSERTLQAFALANIIYSNPFYQQNCVALSVVEALINNDYADSVAWEKSEVDWQKKHADVLRHSGYHMFFAVVLLLAGRDKLREISARFRAYSHEVHLYDICKAL